MSTNKEEPAPHQARGPQKRRTREDHEKRDAAFAQKKRGRPKGSRAFLDDPDRFAVAMIYCGECFLGLSRYSAAYITVSLTSDRPIDPGLIDKALRLSGGPRHATLKGASYTLIAKCDRSMAIADADWVASSAALLGSLVSLQRRRADPMTFRAIFDGLSARGWGPMLLKVAGKVAAVGASNLPPIDEPLSARAQAMLDNFSSKPKS
jgi:hypothetical protein